MAAHSNRSPSPLSSRPTTNPISRNSENNQTNRRSFSGNSHFTKPSVLANPRRFDPITPANSPSDFTRRRSVGKEVTGSNLKDCEEKENNEKDLNLSASSKLQSPAKGCKNFMSPTISAASKVTPSPRKKVLVERNDPVRTSISLSDGKAMFFSATPSNLSEDLNSKSEMDSYQNTKTKTADFVDKKEAILEGHSISKPLKRVSFSEVPLDSQYASDLLSESTVIDSNSLKLESSLTTSIAQLDADPSLPPYDPKNNYLSPRPQFLHYKPKPRIEILLNKEKGLDPDEFNLLEDNFMAEIMSDNFSESECTEESQTEDSQEEQIDVTSSDDIVLGAEETENEPLPVSTTVDNAKSEENLVHKIEKKKWGFSRLMCFSMVIMFLIACASISIKHSPAFDEIVLEDFSLSDVSNYYHQSRFAVSAKANLDRLARHVNQFSADLMSFARKMINELDQGQKLSPSQFVNLSDVQESTWNGAQFMRNDIGEELVENLEEDEMEEEVNAEMSSFGDVDSDESFEKEIDSQDDVLETKQVSSIDSVKCDEEVESVDVDSDESFKKEIDSQDDVLETEQVSSIDSVKCDEEVESENLEIIRSEIVSDINTDKLSESNIDDQLDAILQEESKFAASVDVSPDKAESEKIHGHINLDSSTSLDNKRPLEVNPLSEDLQSSIKLDSSLGQSENKFLSHYVMGMSSLLASLLAFAAFLNRHKRNPGSTVQIDNSLNKRIEKPFSHNWQTEVDEIGESSCPSEMSSFRKCASYSKKELTSEVQSFERKTRKYSKRESLASSSSEFSLSPSYGSFTTYERIPIKHANGDEEIITPVRRSSRIRNHLPVISP